MLTSKRKSRVFWLSIRVFRGDELLVLGQVKISRASGLTVFKSAGPRVFIAPAVGGAVEVMEHVVPPATDVVVAVRPNELPLSLALTIFPLAVEPLMAVLVELFSSAFEPSFVEGSLISSFIGKLHNAYFTIRFGVRPAVPEF